MRDFTSIDWFAIRGKRLVTVALDREEQRDTLLQKLQAEGVKVDGIERKALAFESWALATLRRGTVIGPDA